MAPLNSTLYDLGKVSRVRGLNQPWRNSKPRVRVKDDRHQLLAAWRKTMVLLAELYHVANTHPKAKPSLTVSQTGAFPLQVWVLLTEQPR